MKALFPLAILLAQAATTTPEPPPEPWRGSLAQGLAEVQRLSEAEKPDEALAIAERILSPGKFARWREQATAQPGWKRRLVETADPLLAAVGLSDLSQPGRAAVHYARGVVLAGAEKRSEAAEAFERSRSLAGPGDLRLDATYDLGWTALADGEAFRAQIPELGGKPAAQPAQPAPPAPAAPGAAVPAPPADPKPDPLELARAAYLKAREHFVERLKSDASDADTRANAELVQKRLRELAEIQKKREEEKKKQQDQQKQDQQKNDQDKDKKDQDKKDPSSKDQDPKKPDEQPKPDEKDKDKNKDQQKEKEPPKDQDSEADKKKKEEAQPQSTKEGQLTKEEIMRLLDTLKDREEEGKKILEQLRRARRAKVKKDW